MDQPFQFATHQFKDKALKIMQEANKQNQNRLLSYTSNSDSRLTPQQKRKESMQTMIKPKPDNQEWKSKKPLTNNKVAAFKDPIVVPSTSFNYQSKFAMGNMLADTRKKQLQKISQIKLKQSEHSGNNSYSKNSYEHNEAIMVERENSDNRRGRDNDRRGRDNDRNKNHERDDDDRKDNDNNEKKQILGEMIDQKFENIGQLKTQIIQKNSFNLTFGQFSQFAAGYQKKSTQIEKIIIGVIKQAYLSNRKKLQQLKLTLDRPFDTVMFSKWQANYSAVNDFLKDPITHYYKICLQNRSPLNFQGITRDWINLMKEIDETYYMQGKYYYIKKLKFDLAFNLNDQIIVPTQKAGNYLKITAEGVPVHVKFYQGKFFDHNGLTTLRQNLKQQIHSLVLVFLQKKGILKVDKLQQYKQFIKKNIAIEENK